VKQCNFLELTAVFLRLGLTAFGGPLAHIAMMRNEFVDKRRWLTNDEFLELIAATNLIPGPNSTEMAIHLGYKRGGAIGLVLAGVSFILPASIIVCSLAWVYTKYGNTPELGWLMYGIGPVVIAIICDALIKLGRSTINRPFRVLLATIVLALSLNGFNELALLAGGAAIGLGLKFVQRTGLAGIATLTIGATSLTAAVQTIATEAVPFTLSRLTLFFFKVGSLLFGSGYVLIAFLRADLTDRWGWLTNQQLLDAITVGQITPGPLFTTATFIGYLLGGWLGAVLATIAIFTPAFFFVALSQPLIDQAKKSSLLRNLLSGLVIASFGLMAAVTWQLTQTTVVDIATFMIFAGASAIATLWKTNWTWLILAGGVLGWFLQAT